MAEREYKDSEGNVVTLDKLVRIEPEWAANIIRWYEGKLDEYEHQNEALASRLEKCRSALREAMEWNWIDPEGIPEDIVRRCESAAAVERPVTNEETQRANSARQMAINGSGNRFKSYHGIAGSAVKQFGLGEPLANVRD